MYRGGSVGRIELERLRLVVSPGCQHRIDRLHIAAIVRLMRITIRASHLAMKLVN